MPTQDEKNMAGLIPLLGIFSLALVSIIIWVLKKNESEYIDIHGKEYVNFLISILIYSAIAGILCIIVIGLIILPIIGIAALVFNIIHAIKAFSGEYYTYPLIIRFIK